MSTGWREGFNEIARQRGLPSSVSAELDTLYLPLFEWVISRRREPPFILGINGAQGSGKSTLCALLELLLREKGGLRVVTVSLDDLYLSRDVRAGLADTVHPLAAIRGVPGTHDLDLAMALLDDLSKAQPRDKTRVPRFDKARDDRLPKADWDVFEGRPDVVLFEGWCVGAGSPDKWKGPCNEREAREDPEGKWVTWSNNVLRAGYQDLFGVLDALWMIRVPSMEAVVEGRWKQEEALRTTVKASKAKALTGLMSRADVEDYVSLFERLTLQMLRDMPSHADLVLDRDLAFRISVSAPSA